MPSLRIVLVDDVAEIRELTRYGLEDEGGFVVVGEGGDGEEAVTLVGDLGPDAVVLDLSMPRVDGLEALDRLRAMDPHVGIVVFSGFAADRMAETVSAGGADAYVEKGAPLRELCGAIEQAVAIRKAALA